MGPNKTTQDLVAMPNAASNGVKDLEASDKEAVVLTTEQIAKPPDLRSEDDKSNLDNESVVQSDGEEEQSENISTEWTEELCAGLESFKTVERRLSKCLDALDLKDNVKRLEAAVEIHQRMLSKLRKLAASQDFNDDQAFRSRSRSPSLIQYKPASPSTPLPQLPPSQPQRFIYQHLKHGKWVHSTQSIPEIFYAPWEEVVLGPVKETPYYSVEIPFNEPSSTDLLQTNAERPTPINLYNPEETALPPPPPPMNPPYHGPVLDSGHNAVEQPPQVRPVATADVRSYPAPDFLPERIRINSYRLQSLLIHDLAAIPLSFGYAGPLHLLRPFKALWDVRDRIRARICDFELARSSLGQLREEDYTAELESEQLLDSEFTGPVDEHRSSRVLLTAYIKDLRCLNDFNTNLLEPEVTRISKGPDTVRFSDLWFLFPPGTLVIVKDSNMPQKIWKVGERSGGRWNHGNVPMSPNGTQRPGYSDFRVDCFYLEYNGSWFVPLWSSFLIPDFEGTQETANLNVVPVDLLARDKNTFDKAAALERGQQFLDYCTKPCHRYYTGRSHNLTPKGTKLVPTGYDSNFPRNASGHAERIESEVIVDFERAFEEVPYWLPIEETFMSLENVVYETGRYVGQEGTVLDDRKWNQAATDTFLESERRKWRVWDDTGSGPSGDDLLLLPDRVFAFVLRTRKWVCLPFHADSDGKERLQALNPRAEPWTELELPDGHKKVVQSLIESHFSGDKTRKMHLDLVRDKGKGVIILLHGVPGVGKTSTAECAAESNGRPLLPITCGDLGLLPNEVESKLQEIFRLAHAWNCVLLLDEADIFLAQRTSTDIQRNALVSVFLRVLEYYEGILFLTTNRVGTFDEAFKSRIHMSLYYPPLNNIQTRKIWETNIRKVEKNGIEIDSAAILKYARHIWKQQQTPDRGPVWNGRQIRNAFQSAIALAGFHSMPEGSIKLEVQYFRSVNKVSEEFTQYLFKTKHGETDADWNKRIRIRRDDFVFAPDGFSQPPMAATGPRPMPNFQGHQSTPAMSQYGGHLYEYPGYPYPNAQQTHQQRQQQGFQQPPVLPAQVQGSYPAQATQPVANPPTASSQAPAIHEDSDDSQW